MEDALESFKTAGKLKNDDGESLYRFAHRCFDFKEFASAASAVDEYLTHSKQKRRKDSAYLLRAKAELENGQYEVALSTLQTVQQSAKDIRVRDEAGFITGLIFSEYKNDCDSAILYWEDALKTIKRDDFIRRINVEIGYCYIKHDDLVKAEDYLMKTATRARPDINYDKSMFLLGDIYLFKHDYKKAKEFYTNLITSKPGSDYTNDAIERLSVLSTVGIDDSGILSDNSVLNQFSKAIKAWVVGNYEDAAQLMSDPELEGSQIAEQSLYYTGLIYSESGNHIKTKETFQNYIKVYPDGLFADRSYLALGDIYNEIDNDPARAAENYNKILELFPNSVVIEIARERLREIEPGSKIG
jgi:tetratricopeptide (TPR) repeat protein